MARQRPPTDDETVKTEIYDSQSRTRAAKSTKKGFESGAHPRVEMGTPTEIDPPQPIQVFSMKTPAELATQRKKAKTKQHKAEIRALSELGRSATPPRGMGYLAPPADPKERHVRKVRDWLIWGSVLVIISCVVMLGVWFLAGR
jgi:hypothetical protein